MIQQLSVLVSILSLFAGSAALMQLNQLRIRLNNKTPHPDLQASLLYINNYFFHFLAFGFMALVTGICIYTWVNLDLNDLTLIRLIGVFIFSMVPMSWSSINLADKTHAQEKHHFRFWLKIDRLLIWLLLITGFILIISTGWITWIALATAISCFIFIQVTSGFLHISPRFNHDQWFSSFVYFGVALVIISIEIPYLLLESGTNSYISMTLPALFALESFRAMALSRSIEQQIPTPISDEYNFDQYDLTDREQEIAEAVIEGLSNKQIAFQFELTLNTVRNHLSNIFKKTGARKRTELFKLFRF